LYKNVLELGLCDRQYNVTCIFCKRYWNYKITTYFRY